MRNIYECFSRTLFSGKKFMICSRLIHETTCRPNSFLHNFAKQKSLLKLTSSTELELGRIEKLEWNANDMNMNIGLTSELTGDGILMDTIHSATTSANAWKRCLTMTLKVCRTINWNYTRMVMVWCKIMCIVKNTHVRRATLLIHLCELCVLLGQRSCASKCRKSRSRRSTSMFILYAKGSREWVERRDGDAGGFFSSSSPSLRPNSGELFESLWASGFRERRTCLSGHKKTSRVGQTGCLLNCTLTLVAVPGALRKTSLGSGRHEAQVFRFKKIMPFQRGSNTTFLSIAFFFPLQTQQMTLEYFLWRIKYPTINASPCCMLWKLSAKSAALHLLFLFFSWMYICLSLLCSSRC